MLIAYTLFDAREKLRKTFFSLKLEKMLLRQSGMNAEFHAHDMLHI